MTSRVPFALRENYGLHNCPWPRETDPFRPSAVDPPRAKPVPRPSLCPITTAKKTYRSATWEPFRTQLSMGRGWVNR